MPSIIHRVDLGSPAEPGEYELGGALVCVEPKHIAAWREAPDTAFRTILCTSLRDRRPRVALGQAVTP